MRPTAVATSASEMPAMTVDAPRRRLVARQIVEGLDDAEDGAEEADERRVVAERAEEGEVALEAHALARLGAFDRRRQLDGRGLVAERVATGLPASVASRSSAASPSASCAAGRPGGSERTRAVRA